VSTEFRTQVGPNPWGPVYPTGCPEAMVAALGIRPGDRVLDVGGGAAPFPAATVVLEYDLVSGHDRDHKGARPDDRWVCGDVQGLPFADGSFDFVYCSHVLEHVRDPAKACGELMRMAERGYLETPRKMTELFAGYPSHRWLVDLVDGVLTFERRWFLEHPLQNMALAHAHRHPDVLERALGAYRNLTCVQLAWEGKFRFQVADDAERRRHFDYDRPNHAAWSHFFFALNLLANGDGVDVVRGHVDIALGLLPDEALFHVLAAVVWVLSRNPTQARQSLGEAERLGCTDPALPANRCALANGTCSLLLPLGRGRVDLPVRRKGAAATHRPPGVHR
jgi:SAM-dependent methyltransferase